MTAAAAVASTLAARLHGRGDVRAGIEPVANRGPGEVLIRPTAVGLCGSDLHWYEDAGIGETRLARPLVLGHEFAAVIAEGPRTGERVAVDPADPCGSCPTCLAGNENLCLAVRFAGHGTTDGALRTVMPWPERLLRRLPDALSDDEGALLEPLGVALHALDLAHVAVGSRVGIYGSGPIGLLLVQLARLAGASSVVATDVLAHRVEAAHAFGADEAFVVDDADDSQDDAMTDGRLAARAATVDVAFEAAGSDGAVSDAIAAIRPGGRVVLAGIPGSDRTTFPAGAARRKGLSFLVARRMVAADLDRAIELAGSGRVRLAPLITERFPLDRVADAFAALATRRGLKVIVNPGAAVPPEVA